MGSKSFLQNALAAILGIIILGSIVNIIEVILLTGYFFAFKPEHIENILKVLYLLTGLFILIAGIYLGLKCYKNKNIWYSIFRPTKSKLLISAAISLLIIILTLILTGEKAAFTNLYNFKPVSAIFAIPLMFISYLIYFYPFSALCESISQHRKEEMFKKSKAAIIILLIILNPVFIIFGSAAASVYRYRIMNEPCGVKIVGFNEPSAAKESGMQINDIIIKVNEFEINSLSELKEFMDTYDPPKDLIIHTKTNSYSVEPRLQHGKYTLGVNLTQELCGKGIQR